MHRLELCSRNISAAYRETLNAKQGVEGAHTNPDVGRLRGILEEAARKLSEAQEIARELTIKEVRPNRESR